VLDLESAFRAKDVTVQYGIAIILLVMTWALIVTVFAAKDMTNQRENVVRVYCLSMVALSLAVTMCRMWIIKYDMLHPALQLCPSQLTGAGAPTAPTAYAVASDDLLARSVPQFEQTRRYLVMMAACFGVGICTAVAGAVCLVSTAFDTQAAGVGLCMGTTLVFTLTNAFYRRHAGVYVAAVSG
jgi:hypothetical protein